MNRFPTSCSSRFNPVSHWSQTVDSLLEEVFNTPMASKQPRYDVYTDKQNYHVDIELPGIKKHNVQVSVEGDKLQVKAEYTEVESKFFFLRRERPVGSISQSFQLGKNMDTAKLEARFEDGILHLTIPVKAEAAGRVIPVN